MYLAVQIIQICHPHAQHTLPETRYLPSDVRCSHALLHHNVKSPTEIDVVLPLRDVSQ